ncbi:putative ribonuclease H-like domain-containing protein [Tanacetum coccineum]
MDKCKTGLGYNAIPPSYSGNFIPPKSDLVYPTLDDFIDVNESVSESVVEKPTVETNGPKTDRKENGAPIIEDLIVNTIKGIRVNTARPKAVLSAVKGNKDLYMDLFGPTFVKSLMKKMYCLVVTDDFSRFSWVFFLATKDETSEILKTFITSIENLIDLKVKVIRCDNETGFKNKVMNQFCEMKGRKLALSFMRPFGCHVIILNTIDHLGKFDRKDDEGFIVGYSTNSKAFRVQKHVMMKNSNDSPNAGFKPSSEEENKDAKDPMNESGNLTEGKDSEVPSTEEPRINQEKDDNINRTNNINTASDGNNTNNVNAVSSTVNATRIKVNVVDPKTSIELLNDPNMLEMEDIVYSDDDEDVGAEANITI